MRQAHWWEIVGAVGVIAGLVFTVWTSFFADVDSVPPNDPIYPELGAHPVCEGYWAYSDYKECEDRSSPITRQITDADICGVTLVEAGVEEYLQCAHPSHGVDGYENKKVFEMTSPWMSGGHDQLRWCSQVEGLARSEINQTMAWSIISRSEQSKKDWKGHVTYKYFCRGQARWGPIYKTVKSPACGVKERAVTSVPNSCDDPNAIEGYKLTRRKECGASAIRQFVGPDIEELVAKVNRDEIAWYKCSTCDAFAGAEDRTDYAECLIASAFYFMESGDASSMQLIRRKLVAIKSNPTGVKSSSMDRVIDQIEHLKEAN